MMARRTTRADAAPLIVFDRDRRTYAGLSTDGRYWHLIRPAQADEPGVAGELTCGCAARTMLKPCWRLQQARELEAGQPTADAPVPGQTTILEALGGNA